jgi:tetratricopeptide (TPR) repeat protein
MLLVAVAFTNCTERVHRGVTDENQRQHVDSVIFEAFDTRDMTRTLFVIDSMEYMKELSKVRNIFYRTITHNQRGEYRKSLTYYYKLADIDACQLDDQGDFECYVYSCKDYLRLLCNMKRYDMALREVKIFDDRLKKAGDDDFTRLHDIAEMIGECQLYFGQTAEAARSFQNALDDIHDMLTIHHAPLDFRECQHTMKAAALAYINAGDFTKAAPWVERQDSLFTIANNRSDRDTLYIDEMKADICYCKALLEQARGGKIAAERAYRDYLSTRTSKRLGHVINSTEYLMLTHRYEEAADNYDQLPRFMRETAIENNIENIGRYLVPRLRANLYAGRRDSALSVATLIAETYDSALVRQRRSDAAMLAAVYDTEARARQVVEQKAQLSQNWLIAVCVVLLLIIVVMAVYAYRRRKAYYELHETNRQLIRQLDSILE